MQFAIIDQHARLHQRIPAYAERPFSFTDARKLPERITARQLPLTRPLHDLATCNFDFLFRYEIFPPEILVFAAEWERAGRAMTVGDVLVQQANVLPLPGSIKVIFGVRVLNMTRSATLVGLRYGTLAGHAERGIAEFAFALRGGELYAVVRSHSEPGTWLSRMAAPFFTTPYQQYGAGQVAERMRARFIAANLGL